MKMINLCKAEKENAERLTPKGIPDLAGLNEVGFLVDDSTTFGRIKATYEAIEPYVKLARVWHEEFGITFTVSGKGNVSG